MTPPPGSSDDRSGGPPPEDESRRSTASSADPNDPKRALAPMDFSTFVLSLASSAAVNLGQVPAPDADEPSTDLPAAKQIIDILGVLEDKTRGNLDESEDKLLRSILYDLRVQYVDAQKARKP